MSRLLCHSSARLDESVILCVVAIYFSTRAASADGQDIDCWTNFLWQARLSSFLYYKLSIVFIFY